MKYSETGFRAIYKQFVVFPKNKTTAKMAESFPGIDEANCVLGYGYIDREAGLTVEVIAGGIQDGDYFTIFDSTTEIKAMLRIGSVIDDEFWVMNDEEGSLAERYKEKLDVLKGYDASDEVEETRQMGFLDECRSPEYPDDIMVYLVKEGLQPEGCWTRLTGIGDHFLVGDLLNEPDQDFGYHLGEMIGIFVQKNEDESIICYSDMNPSKQLTAEDLEDGSMLIILENRCYINMLLKQYTELSEDIKHFAKEEKPFFVVPVYSDYDDFGKYAQKKSRTEPYEESEALL